MHRRPVSSRRPTPVNTTTATAKPTTTSAAEATPSTSATPTAPATAVIPASTAVVATTTTIPPTRRRGRSAIVKAVVVSTVPVVRWSAVALISSAAVVALSGSISVVWRSTAARVVGTSGSTSSTAAVRIATATTVVVVVWGRGWASIVVEGSSTWRRVVTRWPSRKWWRIIAHRILGSGHRSLTSGRRESSRRLVHGRW